MKTKSRFLPPKTRKVGHHPYIYLPPSLHDQMKTGSVDFCP
jgi:hypothetical protein